MGARGSGRRGYHYQLRPRIVNIANRLFPPSPIFLSRARRSFFLFSSFSLFPSPIFSKVSRSRSELKTLFSRSSRKRVSITFCINKVIRKGTSFSEGKKEIGSALTRRKKEERSGNRFSSGKCFQKRRQRLDS